jgi:cold shock CspA family protein
MTSTFDGRSCEGVWRTGEVRWYKEDAGYGRITADDREVLFVHFTGVAGAGYRSLDAGQRVPFIRGRRIQDHGRHAAEDVTPAP